MYNVITLMLGYATVNDASPSATYLVDDIHQSIDPATIGLVTLSIGNDFQLYPNPVQKDVTFVSAKLNITSIKVFDVMGKQVFSSSGDSKIVTLDLGHLMSGT
ncbi:T9SS type A sorting domain-containing protein [Crocinitomicaceae bacterium]|nr:T9SS type A sorting domain-containing protein [Crocinitomicaceae bacterium]